MPRKKPPDPPPRRRVRGTGSISVAADGTIRARLPASVDPKRPARAFRPGQLDAAHAWLDGYLNPQPAAPVALTLGDWTGHWWRTFVEPIHPPNTAKWYLYALQQLAALDGVLLTDIRPSTLQGVVGALAGRVDAATVQGVVGVWRRCLDAAIDDDVISKNPARRLTVPKRSKPPPARHITADEVAALWPAISGKRFEPAYALMLGCGLRIGEILGLYWEHVDFVGHRIWIQHQFTNGHWRALPKGRNPHWVPMPERVAVALRRHQDSQPAGYVLVMQSPHRGRLAKREKKPRPWSRNSVANDLANIVKALGLDALTTHAGRHGLATHLMEHGVPPPVIAERLGNTPGVVLATYGHATPEGRRRADELVDRYLDGDDVGEIRAAQ
jgi:integrase